MTGEKGRGNELVLLLDYQEDLSLDYTLGNEDDIDLNHLNFDAIESVQKKEAKIQISTLSSDKDLQIVSSEEDESKESLLGNANEGQKLSGQVFEECRTNELLKKCSCVPLETLGLKASQNFQV